MSGMRGEVALVTGGSSGIGLACAELLAAQGARVYLAARDRQRLAAAAAAIAGDVRVLTADLATIEGAQALVRQLEEAGEPRLDLLLNCAGQLELGPAEEAGVAAAERLVQINYLGAARAVEVTLPLLRRGSRRSIVNVSSLAGRMAPPYMAAYAGSKFALTGYTHVLRQELRCEGFHVGLVCPGPVATPMIEGRVRTSYYPLPPGVPIISAEQVARAILRLVQRRRADAILPARLALGVRLAGAFPRVVDWLYRWFTPAPPVAQPAPAGVPAGGKAGAAAKQPPGRTAVSEQAE